MIIVSNTSSWQWLVIVSSTSIEQDQFHTRASKLTDQRLHQALYSWLSNFKFSWSWCLSEKNILLLLDVLKIDKWGHTINKFNFRYVLSLRSVLQGGSVNFDNVSRSRLWCCLFMEGELRFGNSGANVRIPIKCNWYVIPLYVYSLHLYEYS